MEVWNRINDPGYRGYRTAGNERTAFLKTVALALMVVDHFGVVFFHNAVEWRAIGRLAFPIYAWCLVVGMGYTRNPIRYSARLLFMCAVSQYLYMTAMGHSLNDLNVMMTLLLGQLAIYGMQRRWAHSEIWAPVLTVLVTMLVNVDYGFRGVLLIILLYLAKDRKRSLIAVMIAYCFFWGEGTSLVTTLFGIPLSALRNLTPRTPGLYQAIFRLQNFAVFSLFLTVPSVGWKWRHPAWLSYLAYPGHYLIIILLKTLPVWQSAVIR